MAEILKDGNLTAEDKQLLFDLARTRFKHRRRMAYIALFAMIAITVGGFWFCKSGADMIWLSSPFTVIVGAYYGVSVIRPNS